MLHENSLFFFSPYGHSKNKIEVELDLFNYGTKSELENATGVDTSQFTKKMICNLKTNVHKLDIDKSEKLDVDKLALVPVNSKTIK